MHSDANWNWSQLLTTFNEATRADVKPLKGKSKKKNKTDREEEVLKELIKLYDNEKPKPQHQALTIPRFYHKSASRSKPQAMLEKAARTMFVEMTEEQWLMSDEEKETLFEFILKYQTTPIKGDAGPWVDYDAYLKISEKSGPIAQRWMTSDVFLKFPRDHLQRINADSLYKYIMRRMRCLRLRVSLLLYDVIGKGYLREQDLEKYVVAQIPDMEQLSTMDKDFYKFYVFTAVRKFFFFLDPPKRGKIKISTLCRSVIMYEFHRLRKNDSSDDTGPPGIDYYSSAWFTLNSSIQVYASYLTLDKDQNGMLTMEEFKNFDTNACYGHPWSPQKKSMGTGSLTSAIIKRVFEEVSQYPNEETKQLEMDYKTFLDFTLALRYKQSKQGLDYFWRLLDIRHQGALDIFTLNYFFKDIKKKMSERVRASGEDMDNVSFKDVNDTLFDMICPEQESRISYRDLARCHCAGVVISVLTDLNAFLQMFGRGELPETSREDPAFP